MKSAMQVGYCKTHRSLLEISVEISRGLIPRHSCRNFQFRKPHDKKLRPLGRGLVRFSLFNFIYRTESFIYMFYLLVYNYVYYVSLREKEETLIDPGA